MRITPKVSELLGMAIMAHALSMSSSYIENAEISKNLNHEEQLKIVSLNLAVIALAVDNQLYGKYGEVTRNNIMDMASIKVTEMSKEAFGNDSEMVESLFASYYQDLAPYAGRIYPEGKESPKGFLAWEYSKLLVQSTMIDKKVFFQAYGYLGASIPELLKSVKL